MNEFVKVTFPSRRTVLVDGAASGFTNETFVVQRGFHEFALEPPPDFMPPSQEHSVVGTTRPTPFVIVFDLALVGEPVPMGAAKKRAAKKRPTRKRARKTRAAKKRRTTTKRVAKKRTAQAKKARRTRKR